VNRVTETTDPGERADYMKRIGLDPNAAGRGTKPGGDAARSGSTAGGDG
jgi:hypothetical protein